MSSIQRKFAACLITLFVISSASFTCQTAKLTQGDCNEECNLAKKIQDCLKSKGIVFKEVSATKVNGELSVTIVNIEVVLNADTPLPVDCKVINAIRECTLNAVGYESGCRLVISIAPSSSGAPAYVVYTGIHKGTGTDTDSMPVCVDVLALKTLKIRTCEVKSKVSEEAKRLGIRFEKLGLKVRRSEGNKPYLEVSGKALAQNSSESQVRMQVRDMVMYHTGAQRISTDKLQVYKRSGKDSSVK
jgi:hypothetical protein